MILYLQSVLEASRMLVYERRKWSLELLKYLEENDESLLDLEMDYYES